MDNSSSSAMEWISALRAGDEAAAGKLWDRYARRMEGLAARWLTRAVGPMAFDEEDVAISAFGEIVAGVDAGRFESLTSSDDLWRLMAVVTARKAGEHLRHQGTLKRSGRPGARTVSLQDSNLDIDVPADDATPEVAAMMVEELRTLITTMDDPEMEQLIVLKLDGHTNAEIAERLGYARSTIQRMLNTVRRTWQEVSRE